MKPWIEQGYAVVAVLPSCALMLKQQWPLIVPDDEDVAALAAATMDIDEYVIDIARTEGLAEGLTPIDGAVTVHIPCHSRAQNIGRKSAELLKLIPGATLQVIERCSGHGGSWGVKSGNFETALKVGRPVARQAVTAGNRYLVSACPLAAEHILQGMQRVAPEAPAPDRTHHPIEILAKAYGW
jgi:glycerol-3-phosphate dehydrogenase subunit C